MSRREAQRIAFQMARQAGTYGRIEALAGVTDRVAFWKDRTEQQARHDLRALIAERLLRGELQSTLSEAPPC